MFIQRWSVNRSQTHRNHRSSPRQTPHLEGGSRHPCTQFINRVLIPGLHTLSFTGFLVFPSFKIHFNDGFNDLAQGIQKALEIPATRGRADFGFCGRFERSETGRCAEPASVILSAMVAASEARRRRYTSERGGDTGR